MPTAEIRQADCPKGSSAQIKASAGWWPSGRCTLRSEAGVGPAEDCPLAGSPGPQAGHQAQGETVLGRETPPFPCPIPDFLLAPALGGTPAPSQLGKRAGDLSHGPVDGDRGSDVGAGPAHSDTRPRPSGQPVLRPPGNTSAAPHFSSVGVETCWLPSIQTLLCGSLGQAGGGRWPARACRAHQFLKSQRGRTQQPKGAGREGVARRWRSAGDRKAAETPTETPGRGQGGGRPGPRSPLYRPGGQHPTSEQERATHTKPATIPGPVSPLGLWGRPPP